MCLFLVQYFRLEDITKQFKNPNILDVKVGPITYDPDATPEKIAQEKSKYPPLPLVRFQLIGMRVSALHFFPGLHIL